MGSVMAIQLNYQQDKTDMAKKVTKRTKKAVKKAKGAKSVKLINNPVIDDAKKFSKVLPSLPKDVYEALKDSIRKDGLRERLTVWNWKGKRILIDGHNRLKICNELGMPYKIREKSFVSEEEVKSWMWENQESRRNMTPYQRIEVVLQFKGVVEEQAKQNLRDGGGSGCEKVHKGKLKQIRTSEVLGNRAGVSYRQVCKVLDIRKKTDEGMISSDVIDALREGKVSINKIHKTYCSDTSKTKKSKSGITERSNRFFKSIKTQIDKFFPRTDDRNYICEQLSKQLSEWANSGEDGVSPPQG
jgi:hypothetical protein